MSFRTTDKITGTTRWIITAISDLLAMNNHAIMVAITDGCVAGKYNLTVSVARHIDTIITQTWWDAIYPRECADPVCLDWS